HDDEELAVDDVVAFERENIGMADGLDPAKGLELLFGAHAFIAGGLQVSEDELDRLEEPAGRFDLPDLAEPASAQALAELVSGDGLGLALDPDRHESILRIG